MLKKLFKKINTIIEEFIFSKTEINNLKEQLKIERKYREKSIERELNTTFLLLKSYEQTKKNN